MIIWLASYPRSGNTLLRQICRSVFKLGSYSKYDDLADIGKSVRIKDAVGHKILHDSWSRSYSVFRDSEEIHLIKTHDPPEDDSPAIYVVRNGLDAVSSYNRYIQTHNGSGHSLSEVIAGSVGWFPSWGSHLDLWRPDSRANTLIVKFEDMITNATDVIRGVSRFLKREATGCWENKFNTLQEEDPEFFRKGLIGKGENDFSDAELEMFWTLHGDWFERLSYGRPKKCISTPLPIIRKEIYPREPERHFKKTAEQRLSQVKELERNLRIYRNLQSRFPVIMKILITIAGRREASNG